MATTCRPSPCSTIRGRSGSDAIAGDLVLADEVIRLAGFTLTVEGGVTQPRLVRWIWMTARSSWTATTGSGQTRAAERIRLSGSLRMTEPGCSLLVRGSFFHRQHGQPLAAAHRGHIP
ncbi:MAG: hypothetical protein R3F11_23120 [Verrucomicrobiales bacterium]